MDTHLKPERFLLGIDIGTTHCKAGLFALDGKPVKIASRPTVALRAREGEGAGSYIDPEQLWMAVGAAIEEATAEAEPGQILALGIASMAETGLLVDRLSGQALTPFYPWFDTTASPQAERLARHGDALERFRRSGIRPSFKVSLAKLLSIRDRQPRLMDGSVWMGVAEWAAFKLTGEMRAEYSLAGRTYAFDIGQKSWDRKLLASLDLPEEIFPPAGPSTQSVGLSRNPGHYQTSLSQGIPVFIAGHDHPVAAFAAGVIHAGQALDSMGTAEVLIGALEERPLDKEDFDSGLSYGCHAIPGKLYWMGGLSTSGGSVEWLRNLLGGGDRLTYEELEDLLVGVGEGPGDLLYFPYLAGSGSPHTDPGVRAAFVGLNADHTQADLYKAVLEGTAYELEYIRRVGEAVTGQAIHRLVVAGGGARNHSWLQIKADVSGSTLEIPEMPEATLLGAAMIAGVGRGDYRDINEVVGAVSGQPRQLIHPRPDWHRAYRSRYEAAYLAFQEPLRNFFRGLQGV